MSTNKPANGSLNAVRRTLALARPHLRGQGWIMAGGVAMMLIEVVMRVAEPWPLKIVIDAVTVSLGATEGAAEGQSGASVALLVSLSGSCCSGSSGVRAIAQYCSTVVFALVGSRVATRLRSRVFSHLQSLGQKYHSRAQHGDNVQRLVGDVGRLQEVAVSAGLPLVGNVITLVVLSIVMMVMDPLLALVVLGSALALRDHVAVERPQDRCGVAPHPQERGPDRERRVRDVRRDPRRAGVRARAAARPHLRAQQRARARPGRPPRAASLRASSAEPT